MTIFLILLSTTLNRAQERNCADLTSPQLESDHISPIKVGQIFFFVNNKLNIFKVNLLKKLLFIRSFRVWGVGINSEYSINISFNPNIVGIVNKL